MTTIIAIVAFVLGFLAVIDAKTTKVLPTWLQWVGSIAVGASIIVLLLKM